MSEQHLIEDTHAADMRVADIETKAASGSGEDVALAFDEFMRAFEAFKATNEERIGQIEKRLSADVLTIEKLDRINNAIDEHKAMVDELALKSARPQLGASTFRSGSSCSTRQLSRLMSGTARRMGCTSSRRRRCRSAQAPTAAISCRPRPKPR